MMKRIGFFYIIGILSCICAVSCVKDIIMDAKEKPQVAVGCILTEEPVQKLYLSFTKGASLSAAPPLTKATVMLFDGEDKVGAFKREQDNEWTLAYAAKSGHHYRLEVEVPDYDNIWAEQVMPEPVKMLAYGDFSYRIEGLHYPKFTEEEFVPNAEDFDSLPMGTKVYYILNLPHPLWLFAVDYDLKTGRHIIADGICTDCDKVDSFNLTGENYIPPQRTDIPNPYVENSTVSMLQPQLSGQPLHWRYLRFPAEDLTKQMGWWFTISGTMQGKYNCKDFYRRYYGDYGLADPLMPDEGYIEADTVSPDLDTYLVNVYYQQKIAESTDLSTIFIRDNLPTNIHGGLGIFGARCSRKFQWSGEYEYVDDGKERKLYVGPGLNHSGMTEDNWPFD